MKFECKQCGRCCQPGWIKKNSKFQFIVIHDFEIEKMSSYLSLTIDELKSNYRIVNNRISTAHIACSFYKNNECTIHAIKPDGCKKWPWIGMHNKPKKVKESAHFCPGITYEE